MAVRIMSTRREVPNQSPDRQSDNTRLERIGATVRRRALSGSEASTVGFTLVIYTFVGAGLGYWLDKHLETTYWIAIGMLLGTAIGFREMFRLTKKLTKSNALDNDESEPLNSASSQREYSAPPVETSAEEISSERKRIFSVPAPPQASFETQRSTPAAQHELPESSEELIERLMKNDSDNEDSDSEKESGNLK